MNGHWVCSLKQLGLYSWSVRPLILERAELQAEGINRLSTEWFIAQDSWFKTISKMHSGPVPFRSSLLIACHVSTAPSLSTSPGVVGCQAKALHSHMGAAWSARRSWKSMAGASDKSLHQAVCRKQSKALAAFVCVPGPTCISLEGPISFTWVAFGTPMIGPPRSFWSSQLGLPSSGAVRLRSQDSPRGHFVNKFWPSE